MRLSGIFKAAVILALVVCTAGSVAAKSSPKPPAPKPAAKYVRPPSTKGWTLKSIVKGNTVQLILGINNAALLAGYDGTLTKTWGDPTLSKKKKFISLGKSGGVLKYLTLTLDGDPEFNLAFDYQAGALGNDVVITNPVLSFATIDHPLATATAAVTVTDTNGNGATATGAYQRGKFYDARYNTLTSPGDFAFLISGPVNADPYLSGIGTETTSPLWQTIGTPVSDIRSYFGFHLSANDMASGTSSFKVVPEPASIIAMLSALAGFAGFVKRRRS